MQKEQLIQNIDARKQEMDGYGVNINNYERMLSKLNLHWCKASEQYRGKDNTEVANALITEELMNKISDLNFKDKLQVSLRLEKLEQRKVRLVLSVLEDQLNELEQKE